MSENVVSRREVLAAGAAAMAAPGLAAATQSGGEAAPKRPVNLLFINTDQQRFDALSCAGNLCVSTPNLDRLAAEGVRFTHAFTPQPMCVPARTSFMTGLSIHTTHCVSNLDEKRFFLGEGTFDQQLVRRGYAAEHHGRWHAPLGPTECYSNEVTLKFFEPYRKYLGDRFGELPKPKEGQFVETIFGWPYTPDAPDYQLRMSRNDPPPHGVPGVHYGIDESPEDATYTAFVADETIRAIERHRDHPFSITAAFLAPHHPMVVTRRWAESVDPAKMTPPVSLNDKRLNTPYENWPWQMDGTDMPAVNFIQARYYAFVQEVDHHVGRILQTLDRLGLADDTLVIFISDHGEFLGDHGIAQKFLPYQEAVRIPMIMRLPGRIRAGSSVEHVANSIDLMATIADYLEFPCPAQEGRSLRPLVEGGTHDYPEYTFSEFGWEEGYTMFASRDWKYVWTGDPKSVDLLFDLRADPQELDNLLGTNPDRAKHVPQAEAIRETMLDWMQTIRHPYLERLSRSEVG